ncbi:alpha/beta hydrolase [Burkholderia sp. BCC0419]|uniref:alpha/beta hydrolase n=1 Tax=Burkholderia sp. BCC0419 TaxID=486878 RepID=UPI00158DAF0B|nr:alpha/beta hydrolase [Burkholderia sp. BCC0419]
MPVAPSVRQFLERRARPGAVSLDRLPLEEARRYFAYYVPLADLAPRGVDGIDECLIEMRDGARIAARIYYPRAADWSAPQPALLYFHSGGYVVGSLETADAVCRMLAADARCAVVSVSYRLAPEHKFPCAVDDALDALRWLHRKALTYGLDASRLAVGGESSGATLAAVVAVRAREMDIALAMQLLIYPALSASLGSAAHRRYGEDHFLTHDVIRWIHRNYLRDAADAADWRFAPLDGERHAPADLHGVAPAWLVSAEYDPLRDEHAGYADKLRRAGNRVEARCYRGMIHGFFSMGRVIPEAAHAHREAAAALREALGSTD